MSNYQSNILLLTKLNNDIKYFRGLKMIIKPYLVMLFTILGWFLIFTQNTCEYSNKCIFVLIRVVQSINELFVHLNCCKSKDSVLGFIYQSSFCLITLFWIILNYWHHLSNMPKNSARPWLARHFDMSMNIRLYPRRKRKRKFPK